MSDNVNDRGLSRKHIMESIHKTLRRLGTEYLDIYFCHRFDKETEVDEVVCAMNDLIQQGKILYWGTSVWSAAQIEQAVTAADHRLAYAPAVEQPEYNMLHREIEIDVLKICSDHHIGLAVFSPLAQGLLTGKYKSGIPEGSRAAVDTWLQNDLTETNLNKINKLQLLAEETNLTLPQLALAWILRHPEISCAIIGASNVEHVTENAKASGVSLGAEVVQKIEEIITNDPMKM
jgi:aryl-alcohol dehydrogenase-like predicted oxidoreductase